MMLLQVAWTAMTSNFMAVWQHLHGSQGSLLVLLHQSISGSIRGGSFGAPLRQSLHWSLRSENEVAHVAMCFAAECAWAVQQTRWSSVSAQSQSWQKSSCGSCYQKNVFCSVQPFVFCFLPFCIISGTPHQHQYSELV